jgi:hypothetical protein
MLSSATEISVRGFTSTLLVGDWAALVCPMLTAALLERGSDTYTNLNLIKQEYFPQLNIHSSQYMKIAILWM